MISYTESGEEWGQVTSIRIPRRIVLAIIVLLSVVMRVGGWRIAV